MPMRAGWPCKLAAPVLQVSECRLTQALEPALKKMALLWRADPTRTMEAILDAVNKLEPMTEQEINMRELMLNGALDRKVLHPHSNT